MADRCASSFEVNSVALQRGCSTKNSCLNEAFAALRQFVSLVVRFVTVQKHMKAEHTHTYPTTVSLRVKIVSCECSGYTCILFIVLYRCRGHGVHGTSPDSEDRVRDRHYANGHW